MRIQTRREDETADFFAAELADLEGRLAVPYPARAELLEELAADLGAAYHQGRALGLGHEEARARALGELALDQEARQALEGVHASFLASVLGRLPVAVRSWLTAAGSATPLAVLFVFLVREVPVTRFLNEGGPIVYVIVAFGSLGLLLELQRFFIWFVLRDHSAPALARNTATPLYLAAATVLLGILAAAASVHALLNGWRGDVPHLVRGLREPLGAVIMSSCLAALTLLVHSALSVGLRALRIPERDQRLIA